MADIIVNDRKIYYESHGQGEPVVLIRGLGSNADHWYAQVPDLARHYRVITFDNRGIARSDDPGGAFSILDMAKDTIALMDALQIDQAHLVGVSMGGMISQEVAIRYPQRVKGLILVATHGGGKHQVKASQEVLDTFQRMIDEPTNDARRKATTVLAAEQTLKSRPQVLQDFAAVSMKYPARQDILKRQKDAVIQHDAYDRLPRIEAMTLVLTGAEDALVPPGNSKILAERIPKAELLVVPGGGHMVLIEQPQTCNQAMIDFLQRVDGSR